MQDGTYPLDELYLANEPQVKVSEPVLEPWSCVADRLHRLLEEVSGEMTRLDTTLGLALQNAVNTTEFTDRLALVDHATLHVRSLFANCQGLISALLPKPRALYIKWKFQLQSDWTESRVGQFLCSLPDLQVRRNQQARFARELKFKLQKFQSIQEKHRSIVESRLATIYKIEHVDATSGDVESYVKDVMDNSGSGANGFASVFAGQILHQPDQQRWILGRIDDLKDYYDEKQRREEISRINDAINELAEIMLNMNQLLEEQDEAVKSASLQVETSHAALKGGSSKVTKAVKRRRKSRKLAWIICLLLILVVVIVIVVVYFKVIKPNSRNKNSSATPTASPTPVN